MLVDRNGLEVLDREECLRLLATSALGRVGVSFGALPVILPVGFRLVSDRIVFRTGTSTKLGAATRDAVVAFEVDQIDAEAETGWSVVVTGMARDVTDDVEIAALRLADVPRWGPAGPGRLVEISTAVVSGRRIVE